MHSATKVCEAYLWLAMRFPASFPEARASVQGSPNVEALIIRIGFWGFLFRNIVYYTRNYSMIRAPT